MLVMGKTVNEVSTGADVFGEGETGASRLYKLGEGKFLSEKFPFPQFFIPVQRGWGLLFHRRLGLFDFLLDECREIGGFLPLPTVSYKHLTLPTKKEEADHAGAHTFNQKQI